MTEDEMVGWHHRLNGHEFEKTLGNSERLYLFYPKSLQMMTAAMKLKDAYFLEEKL